MNFTVTSQDFFGVMPLIILSATGILVLLWDAFETRPTRIPLTMTIIGAVAAIVSAVMNINDQGRVFSGMILDNAYSNYFAIVFSVGVILAVLLAERYLEEEEVLIGEFAGLILFSACGMQMLASGVDLIVTFLGLETMSIAFYVLSGLFRRRAESNEAAMKYFLLGAFATGFFLYGIALIYGSFGTTNLDVIRGILESGANSPVTGLSAQQITTSPLFWLGITMLLVGFCFKVAAFPFHQWAPDVYEGAPTVVTGFMSTAGKAGAFSAMILIFDLAFAPLLGPQYAVASTKLQTILCVIAVASMFYGNITALSQSNVKRMLAYSSIAHAGYMMLGVASLNGEGAYSVTIYLAVYTLMQLGAFGVVGMLEKDTGGGLFLNDYAGLAKRRPWLAFLMAIMMLSLAGIPPFAGFFGKYYLFTAAIRQGLTVYAVLGVIASLISIYFYLRMIVLMYFRDEAEVGRDLDSTLIATSGAGVGALHPGTTASAWTALVLAAVGLFVLGVLPMLLTNLSRQFFVH